MALEKLTIKTEFGEEIKARFNPERYTVTKSAQIAEITIPGLDSPVQQYVRGQTEKITLELFFDTTEHGMLDSVKDVRKDTGKIYQLLRVRSKTHAPPRCKLIWGDGGKLFSYGTNEEPWCLLESVSEEFTLFSPGGVPLRAKLNVTFREAWTIEQQIKERGRHTGDRTRFRMLERGKTLSHLAWQEYGDPALWRPIADAPANRIDNPRTVAPGTELEVPRITGRPQ
jgi:Contractile injection system tube protein